MKVDDHNIHPFLSYNIPAIKYDTLKIDWVLERNATDLPCTKSVYAITIYDNNSIWVDRPTRRRSREAQRCLRQVTYKYGKCILYNNLAIKAYITSHVLHLCVFVCEC